MFHSIRYILLCKKTQSRALSRIACGAPRKLRENELSLWVHFLIVMKMLT